MNIIPFDRCPELERLGLVRHGFSRRRLESDPEVAQGNMSLQIGEVRTALRSREEFCRELGVEAGHLVLVYQVHGTDVALVDQSHWGSGARELDSRIGQYDALITATPQVPLAILVADCLPIFIVEAHGRGIGLVHAGWRGTAADIAGSTVKALEQRLGCRAEDCWAWIGPGIRDCHFEVGDEVREIFRANFPPEWAAAVVKERTIDLATVNRLELERSGLSPERIIDSGQCTYCGQSTLTQPSPGVPGEGKGTLHPLARVPTEGGDISLTAGKVPKPGTRWVF